MFYINMLFFPTGISLTQRYPNPLGVELDAGSTDQRFAASNLGTRSLQHLGSSDALGCLDLPCSRRVGVATATVGLGVWTFKESSRDFFSGITKEGFGGNNCNTPFFHGFFPGVFQARKAGDSFKPPKLDLPLKNTLSQCCGSPEF